MTEKLMQWCLFETRSAAWMASRRSNWRQDHCSTDWGDHSLMLYDHLAHFWKLTQPVSIDFEIMLYIVHTFRKPLKPFVEVRWASLCSLNLPYPPQEYFLCGSLVPLTSSRSKDPLIENLLSSWQNAVENWSLKMQIRENWK